MSKYASPAASESASAVLDDYSSAVAIIVGQIGYATLADKAVLAPAIVRHQLETGEMTAALLGGCSKRTQDLACLMAGLHDFGKFREDILTRVSSERSFSPSERRWVTEQHSAEGGAQLRRMAGGSSSNDLAAGDLYFAAFAADMHHRTLLPPSEYAELPDRNLALAYGIVDCIRALDPLQALGFDKARSYIEKREGHKLEPCRVFDIVEQERGRSWDEPPVVEEVEIDLKSFVAHALGLDAAVYARASTLD